MRKYIDVSQLICYELLRLWFRCKENMVKMENLGKDKYGWYEWVKTESLEPMNHSLWNTCREVDQVLLDNVRKSY